MSKEEESKDRMGLYVLIAGSIALVIVFWVYLENGSAIENLGTSPKQAILFSASLTIFVWVFNVFFNVFIQRDRSKDSKKLRKELSDLREEIKKISNQSPTTSTVATGETKPSPENQQPTRDEK